MHFGAYKTTIVNEVVNDQDKRQIFNNIWKLLSIINVEKKFTNSLFRFFIMSNKSNITVLLLGKILIECGKICIACSKILIECGRILIKHGKILIMYGKIHIEYVKILIESGKILIECGKIPFLRVVKFLLNLNAPARGIPSF